MTATPASDALRADYRKVEMYLGRLLFAAKHPTADWAGQLPEEFLEKRRLARPNFHKEGKVSYRKRSVPGACAPHADGLTRRWNKICTRGGSHE